MREDFPTLGTYSTMFRWRFQQEEKHSGADKEREQEEKRRRTFVYSQQKHATHFCQGKTQLNITVQCE